MARQLNLEPKARQFVELLESWDGPPMSAGTPEQARAIARALKSTREPRTIARVEDHRVPSSDGALHLRLYCDTEYPFAAILYLHGGGWVLGGLDESDLFARELAGQTGCAVLSVDYRLAPEAPFPAALDDCYAALCWTKEKEQALFGGALPIILLGDSAGGNLATVVAGLAAERGGPAVSAQVLAYPITDANLDTLSYREFAEGPLLTRELMSWFWDHYLPEREKRSDQLASPLRSTSLAGAPPAFILTAENDPLRDEGEAYADALRGAGVAVTLRRYDGQIHGFLTMVGMFDGTEAALQDIDAFIREISSSDDAARGAADHASRPAADKQQG